MRDFAALTAIVIVASGLAFGCSSGLSTSDATTNCNEEKLDKTACFGTDDTVFNACVSCFTRCGTTCTAQETCPETYLCPGDNPNTGSH